MLTSNGLERLVFRQVYFLVDVFKLQALILSYIRGRGFVLLGGKLFSVWACEKLTPLQVGY